MTPWHESSCSVYVDRYMMLAAEYRKLAFTAKTYNWWYIYRDFASTRQTVHSKANQLYEQSRNHAVCLFAVDHGSNPESVLDSDMGPGRGRRALQVVFLALCKISERH
jgi:hypothetical protein